ncbi:hypothetical protein AB6H32_02715 [Providencia hangzhouensis]
MLLTTLAQAVSFITVMGKHPIHSTLVIFLKFRYPKQPVSCYSLLCIHNIHSAHQYNRSPPLLLLPLLSHLHQQPPSPSTSELLLTTLAQAMSFITVMGKHPTHNIYLILLKFRYPKQSMSCYSLFASTISIQRTNTTAPPPLLLLTPAISPSLAANIPFNK